MNVISLGDWIEVCEREGVPYIPATLIGRASIRELYDALDGSVSPAVQTLFEAAQAQREEGFMVRWDACASGEIKYAMARGRPGWQPDFCVPMLDDPRTLSIFHEFPSESMRLWKRPWTRALLHAGFPVEFRVFVSGGEIQGVSSYYPQRPLPEEPFLDIAGRCREATVPLLGAADAFTCDWLLSEEGELLFLEGGPPHIMQPGYPSAHPCCFEPGRIEGTALIDRNPPRLA